MATSRLSTADSSTAGQHPLASGSGQGEPRGLLVAPAPRASREVEALLMAVLPDVVSDAKNQAAVEEYERRLSTKRIAERNVYGAAAGRRELPSAQVNRASSRIGEALKPLTIR
jgi:hypothetical protein